MSMLWLIPAVAALFAIAFATIAVAYDNIRAPRWAAASLGALSVASAIDLSHPVSTVWSLWLAGVGHWIAAGCIMQAMLERLDRSLPHNIVLFGVGLLIPIHAWSILPGDVPDLRILAVNGGAFSLFALGFIRSHGTSRSRLDTVMRSIVGIVMILYPLRMFLYFWFPPGIGAGGFMLSQHMLFLFVTIGVLGSGFSMALLLATGADLVRMHQRNSEIDALTGIANRRAMEVSLASDEHDEHYGAALLIDLDLFKRVNDSHGHDVGDLLLVAVARELSAKLSDFGDVYRLGGEEFAVLLDKRNSAAASAMALVARKAVASVVLPEPNHDIRTTASVGVSQREPGTDMQNVLRNADLAMYQAKAAGRDQAYAAGRSEGLLQLSAVA